MELNQLKLQLPTPPNTHLSLEGEWYRVDLQNEKFTYSLVHCEITVGIVLYLVQRSYRASR